jgi:osmotically-inducible protein OsmY
MARYDRGRERTRNYPREDWRAQNREGGDRSQWRDDDRGFFNRVGDEVRSWFGDDEDRNRQWRDDSWRNRREREWSGQRGTNDWDYEPDYRRRATYASDWNQTSRNWRTDNPTYQRGQFENWRENYGGDRDRERYPESWSRGMSGMSAMSYGNFAGRGPRNYRRSDERMLEDVNEQLTQHPMIDATDIEVSIVEGEVTLRGSVDNRSSKRMAEDVAESVSGVKNVRNEIRVQGSVGRDERAA